MTGIKEVLVESLIEFVEGQEKEAPKQDSGWKTRSPKKIMKLKVTPLQ
jgi:hypothetical protein